MDSNVEYVFQLDIQLEGCEIHDEGAIYLAEALSVNSSVMDIDLNSILILINISLTANYIHGNGAIALANAFKVNKTLKCVNLCCKNLDIFLL